MISRKRAWRLPLKPFIGILNMLDPSSNDPLVPLKRLSKAHPYPRILYLGQDVTQLAPTLEVKTGA